MIPLTRNEVESWPALGPMNLDKQRVLDLIDRAEKAQKRVCDRYMVAMAPQLADVTFCTKDGARVVADLLTDLRTTIAEQRAELAQFRPLVDVLRVERDEARALNTQLAAQVDEARRQREDASARLRELREVAERNVADAQHLRQSAILLTIERDEARRQRDECAAALATIGHQMEAQQILDASEPTPLEAAVTAHTEHVAVSVGAFDDRLRFFGSVGEAVELVDALRSDARVSAAISQRREPSEHVAVITNRISGNVVMARWGNGEGGELTTDEAVALITALLADGAVHAKWLHGRGGR